jgi:hypothetical protein
MSADGVADPFHALGPDLRSSLPRIPCDLLWEFILTWPVLDTNGIPSAYCDHTARNGIARSYIDEPPSLYGNKACSGTSAREFLLLILPHTARAEEEVLGDLIQGLLRFELSSHFSTSLCVPLFGK